MATLLILIALLCGHHHHHHIPDCHVTDTTPSFYMKPGTSVIVAGNAYECLTNGVLREFPT